MNTSKSTFIKHPQIWLFTITLVLGLSVPGWCWNATGHMLIAQIAYDTMPHSVAQRIQKKMEHLSYGEGPYNFVTAACWMDDIKHNPHNPWRYLSRLHYVDIPYSKNGSDFSIPRGQNAITKLQQTIKDLHKSTSDQGLRARQWAIVMHLVGDIHQPLHCADHDDRGGNDVKITGIPDLPRNPKTHNLHFFWDTAFSYDRYQNKVRRLYPPVYSEKRPTSLTSGFVAWQAWRLLKKYPPHTIANHDDLTIIDWARESYIDACKYAYTPAALANAGPVFLDKKYVHQAHEIAAKRIVVAGVRLGKLLTKLAE